MVDTSIVSLQNRRLPSSNLNSDFARRFNEDADEDFVLGDLDWVKSGLTLSRVISGNTIALPLLLGFLRYQWVIFSG